MKTLSPASVWDDVLVPEDGVDPRSAASLEPAFQSLLDRTVYLYDRDDALTDRITGGPGGSGEAGLTGTGNGNAGVVGNGGTNQSGGVFTGNGTGKGVVGTGGDTNGAGGEFTGGATNGPGVRGFGTGTGAGVVGTSFGSGKGGSFSSDSGEGVNTQSTSGTALVAASSSGLGGEFTALGARGAIRLVPRASDPGSGQKGELYVRTSDGALRYHDGTSWKTVTIS